MRKSSLRRAWLVAAVAGPVSLATVGAVIFAALEVGGHTLSSEGPVRNLAEAAALGSASEVVRMLSSGEDPLAVVDVRPFAISSSVRRASALEAAVWSRQAPMLQLFEKAGALRDEQTRQHVVCLARDLRAEEVAAALMPPEDAPDCPDGQTLAAVMARGGSPP